MSANLSSDIKNLSLLDKLSKIGSAVEVVKKNNKGFNYNYADNVEILAKIKSGMKKYRVSLIPEIVPGTAKTSPVTISTTKFDKTGQMYTETKTEMNTTADMLFTWINNDNPDDKISVGWFLTGGQIDPSQGFGGAITYCTRYFLTSYFQSAQTDNDIEEYRSRQAEAEQAEKKLILDEIIKAIDESVRTYIANHEDSGDTVKSFMTKYIKSGDYRKITDIPLASKLLDDFKKKFKEN